MAENRKNLLISLIGVIAVGVIITGIVLYLFGHNPQFKSLFAGMEVPGADSLAVESEAVLAQKMEFTGKVSMWIFIFITLLQLAALWVGYAVVSTIRSSCDPVKLKLRSLDNAEVFFDVPLYFGLFGTVSAFLVMTFSPQSSRLIAYSSTLIGIIFSLLLRLTMQYPLRRNLVRLDALEEAGEAK
ncbi:MAG: hypothetical protein E7043_02375 [Lentisphaerae bacterium]|nr:hypothetical protein [Lentisphaerota bacterium]